MKSILMLCMIAAACGSDPVSTSQIVPGISADPGGGSLVPTAASGESPCRYEEVQRSTGTLGTPFSQSTTGRITFDAAGRDILEIQTDDASNVLDRLETEYDAMGDATHYRTVGDSYTVGDTSTVDSWLAYDSFGRLVRLETDADGTRSSLVTYSYGDRNLRASAHVISANAARSYDRQYTYDANDRLTRLDRDYLFDGTVDESERYAYDDVARTATKDEVDATGQLVSHSDFTYDLEGHVTREAWRAPDASSTGTIDQEYEEGRVTHYTYRQDDVLSDGTTTGIFLEYRYHYSCD